jgi:hypothetical protein
MAKAIKSSGSIKESLAATIKRQAARVVWGKRLLLEFGIRQYLLRGRIEHVTGPLRISYTSDELLVITVVRNGALYIRSFLNLNCYRSLGVKHFVFFDNGSTDRRWNLFVDIDELFDYPFSENLRVRDLLGYLNENKYTAVVTQMLDMFSDIALDKLESKADDTLEKKYVYYDISSLEKEDYLWSERSSPAIKMHWGDTKNGIRYE